MRVLSLLLIVVMLTGCAWMTRTSYEPTSGQAGKDMVWVPTPDDTVETMLDLAGVTANDYVIDLGSGDGRMVIGAARRGARGLGIEYNGDLVALSRQNARDAGVQRLASFREADIFKTDFTDADVIMLFMLPDLIMKIRPQLLAMRPGTRIVSNTFMIGDGDDTWPPDVTRKNSDDCHTWCTAHLWIVPARIDGAWLVGDTRLEVSQHFQSFFGTLGGTPIGGGAIKGASVTFTANGRTYTGTVSADGRRIEGDSWTAVRPPTTPHP
jgi:SAM-dependent methyltransferase